MMSQDEKIPDVYYCFGKDGYNEVKRSYSGIASINICLFAAKNTSLHI